MKNRMHYLVIACFLLKLSLCSTHKSLTSPHQYRIGQWYNTNQYEILKNNLCLALNHDAKRAPFQAVGSVHRDRFERYRATKQGQIFLGQVPVRLKEVACGKPATDVIKISENPLCNQQPVVTISDMPPEVLELIIGFVPFKDRHCLAAVSKAFQSAVGYETVRFNLKTSKLFSQMSPFLSTLELREQIKRALVSLEGNTHKVKHIVIESEDSLLAVPSNLCSFKGLENITFKGADYIENELKTNEHMFYYMLLYIAEVNCDSGELIQGALKGIHKLKPENNIKDLMEEYKNEFQSFCDTLKDSSPRKIPFFSLEKARENLPRLKCITWNNVRDLSTGNPWGAQVINCTPKTYALGTSQDFAIFEKNLALVGCATIYFMFSALGIPAVEDVQSNIIQSASNQPLKTILSGYIARLIAVTSTFVGR